MSAFSGWPYGARASAVSATGKNAVVGQIQTSGKTTSPACWGWTASVSLGITGVLAGVRGRKPKPVRRRRCLGVWQRGPRRFERHRAPQRFSEQSARHRLRRLRDRQGGFIPETAILNVRSSGVRGDSIFEFRRTGRLGDGIRRCRTAVEWRQGRARSIRFSHNWAVFAQRRCPRDRPALRKRFVGVASEPAPDRPGQGDPFRVAGGPGDPWNVLCGSGHVVGGFARIEVPEAFRYVTDERNLTVQLTPVGGLAVLACVSKSLDSIVVQGSADIGLDYMVNGGPGGRTGTSSGSGRRDLDLLWPGRPSICAYAPEIQRRPLVTGIYNADGTVNLETARRLDWDKRWAAVDAGERSGADR